MVTIIHSPKPPFQPKLGAAWGFQVISGEPPLPIDLWAAVKNQGLEPHSTDTKLPTHDRCSEFPPHFVEKNMGRKPHDALTCNSRRGLRCEKANTARAARPRRTRATSIRWQPQNATAPPTAAFSYFTRTGQHTLLQRYGLTVAPPNMRAGTLRRACNFAHGKIPRAQGRRTSCHCHDTRAGWFRHRWSQLPQVASRAYPIDSSPNHPQAP